MCEQGELSRSLWALMDVQRTISQFLHIHASYGFTLVSSPIDITYCGLDYRPHCCSHHLQG